MIVCLCEAVSDRDIRRAIDDGSNTLRDIKQSCGAGGQCGSCCNDLRRMLEARDETPTSGVSSPGSLLLRR
ncbi:MAG: bacterioferritin-associated ferredoxin [Myxococcota bacterium]